MLQMNTMDLPETAFRRNMELRLLHTYVTQLSDPYASQPRPPEVVSWLQKIPELSLAHDHLQYMMHAYSAAYLARTLPDNRDVVNTNQVYLALALRSQQRAVASISCENCVAVLYTAFLHFSHTFTSLWQRSTEPYTAPTEWMRVGKGVQAVIITAINTLKGSPSSSSSMPSQLPQSFAITQRNVPPIFQREVLLAKGNLSFLPPTALLDYTTDASPTSPDAQTAYEEALRYIGSMYLAVATGEPVFALVRRCMAFPIFVPALFVDLVAEQQPRALVILAMFFALMTKAHSVWWIGDIPRREVLAIQRIVPQEWQGAMEWPLEVAGLMPTSWSSSR